MKDQTKFGPVKIVEASSDTKTIKRSQLKDKVTLRAEMLHGVADSVLIFIVSSLVDGGGPAGVVKLKPGRYYDWIFGRAALAEFVDADYIYARALIPKTNQWLEFTKYKVIEG